MSYQMSVLTTVILALSFSSGALANNTQLIDLQQHWAECQYNAMDKDSREACFIDNIDKNTAYLRLAPDNSELKVWLAINKSSLAGAKGGLGALSLVKEAKVILEEVLNVAPNTLDGSAYTSLGSLYYKVPGWPVGFGNDKKAETMLKKALEINPKGIDPNYFYGEFLYEDGRKAEAKEYLTQAMVAPPRVERPLADEGRKKEIKLLLQKLD